MSDLGLEIRRTGEFPEPLSTSDELSLRFGCGQQLVWWGFLTEEDIGIPEANSRIAFLLAMGARTVILGELNFTYPKAPVAELTTQLQVP